MSVTSPAVISIDNVVTYAVTVTTSRFAIGLARTATVRTAEKMIKERILLKKFKELMILLVVGWRRVTSS